MTAFDGLATRGSIFDPAYIRALKKIGFLRTLGQRLSRPVMPNDEALAYLATHYEEKGVDHSGWASEWQRFERSLKVEARFFNQSAASHEH